jgi:hypothetical protein
MSLAGKARPQGVDLPRAAGFRYRAGAKVVFFGRLQSTGRFGQAGRGILRSLVLVLEVVLLRC